MGRCTSFSHRELRTNIRIEVLGTSIGVSINLGGKEKGMNLTLLNCRYEDDVQSPYNQLESLHHNAGMCS